MTVRRALKEIRVANPLVQAMHGEQALDHLGDESNARPCLILLDLNMPIMNGIEFLQVIKQHPEWRRIPVVVLTTSAEPFDVEASYALGVNSYIQKPVDFERFVWAVKQVGLYWLVLNHPRDNT